MRSCRNPRVNSVRWRSSRSAPRRQGPAATFSPCRFRDRSRISIIGLALIALPALLPGVALAQQTISSSTLGPIDGNDNSITVTTSGTIDGIGSGTGVISTGTNTTTTLDNAGWIRAYSRGVLNEATGSFGTITNSGTISGNYAVATTGTIGTLDNQSGGLIAGGDNGVIATGGTIGTLQNAGTVSGFSPTPA